MCKLPHTTTCCSIIQYVDAQRPLNTVRMYIDFVSNYDRFLFNMQKAASGVARAPGKFTAFLQD